MLRVEIVTIRANRLLGLLGGIAIAVAGEHDRCAPSIPRSHARYPVTRRSPNAPLPSHAAIRPYASTNDPNAPWVPDEARSPPRGLTLTRVPRPIVYRDNGNTTGYTRSMSKVMVSLADDLLAELDAEAARRSTSRSALLATAARREIARRDPDRVAAAIERSEQRFRHAGAFEAADLVRADRDLRR